MTRGRGRHMEVGTLGSWAKKRRTQAPPSICVQPQRPVAAAPRRCGCTHWIHGPVDSIGFMVPLAALGVGCQPQLDGLLEVYMPPAYGWVDTRFSCSSSIWMGGHPLLMLRQHMDGWTPAPHAPPAYGWVDTRFSCSSSIWIGGHPLLMLLPIAPSTRRAPPHLSCNVPCSSSAPLNNQPLTSSSPLNNQALTMQ
eukprot:360817-Chlamydomonas_euryale.AAC.16